MPQLASLETIPAEIPSFYWKTNRMPSHDLSLHYQVLWMGKCRSTHHKLAVDALRMLRGGEADAWQRLFLTHCGPFIEGSKAPDDDFKDFKNHVLHVHQNDWGGAIGAAKKWYESTVTFLRRQDWPTAAYHAGVLSHYVTDPVMPFHTGQTEEENTIHRAVEWSVTKSYDQLLERLHREWGSWPEFELPNAADWLPQAIRHTADLAHQHYQAILDHYDIHRGVKDPPAGLDEELRRRFASLLGLAAVFFSRVLERAIEEAGQPAEPTQLSLPDLLAQVDTPVERICSRIEDLRDRVIVDAAYQELRQTGRVIQNLPEELRTIRRLHAAEVLKVPEAELDRATLKPTGTLYQPALALAAGDRLPLEPAPSPAPPGKQAPKAQAPESQGTRRNLRFYLDPSQPIVDAPSIGPRSASRLEEAGVETVADFLACNAEELADRLAEIEGAERMADPERLREWQLQAALACRIPNLRGHDAQILVACGVHDPETLTAIDPTTLEREVAEFVATPEGQRVLRDGKEPDANEIADWIAWAHQARAA